MKVIEEEEYAEFERKCYSIADGENYEAALMLLAEEIEKDLYLIGATGMKNYQYL